MLFAKRTQGLKLGKGELYLVNHIEKGVLFFESLKTRYLKQLLAGLTYEPPTFNIANAWPMGKCKHYPAKLSEYLSQLLFLQRN